MRADSGVPAPRSESEASTGLELLQLQRAANEELVLSSLRAQEEADDAADALRTVVRESTELRTTAEFRERLIGIIGHDFRSPLGAILMSAGLLVERGDLTEADARLVGRIASSGTRMGRMIEQLVDFTRTRLGSSLELSPVPSDMGDICGDIAEELSMTSPVEVVARATGDLRGTWDAVRVAEAISNIAGNGQHHGKRGETVYIDSYADDDVVVTDITNQGTDIPADVLPTIFEAFRRGDAKPKAGHLGLGLYIASEVARAHGGTLAARSKDGTTSFMLRLPRTRPPAPATATR